MRPDPYFVIYHGLTVHSILAYRIEESESPDDLDRLVLERVFPIHAEFIVRISQPQNRGTVTSPPPTPATDTLPGESIPWARVFLVILRLYQDQTLALDIYEGPKRVLSLLTEDKEDLSATLFACRALRDIASPFVISFCLVQ